MSVLDATSFSALRTVTIAGTPVHLVDESGARSVIASALTAEGAPLAVSSINLDHVHHFSGADLAFDGGSVRWLNLIDGAPIAAQARRMTGAAHPRLAGSDIIAGILDDLAAAGGTVAVIGGSAGVTDALFDRFGRDWPQLRVAGHWTPDRDELASAEYCANLCAQLRDAHTDVILVCLGKPRQERWISEYGDQTGAKVLLAFGAVVDFLAGRVSRAPRLISAVGAEWMWRLMLEPRRLAKRYLVQGPPAYVAVRRSSTFPTRV